MVLVACVALVWSAGGVVVIGICLASAACDRRLDCGVPAKELRAIGAVGLLTTVLRFRTPSWAYATCRHSE